MNEPNCLIESHYYITYNSPAGLEYTYSEKDMVWRDSLTGTRYKSYNKALFVMKNMLTRLGLIHFPCIKIRKIERYIPIKVNYERYIRS